MKEQDENRKEYEIAFLLKEEADLKGLLDILKQHEAEITFEGPVKKIALAYEIKKQEVAHFGFLRFTAPANRIPDLEKVLVLHAPVLRSLVTQFIPGRITAPRDPAAFQTSGTAPVVAEIETSVSAPVAETPASTPTSHNLPLSNEDLEKRIEEILK